MRLLALALFLIAFNYSQATILNVGPAQTYSTIQSAINASVNGDTILVDQGTYNEDVNFIGKQITVASWYITTSDTNDINNTIIQGTGSASVATFSSAEDSTSVLLGFTITQGSAANGGGIYCINSSPTLLSLVVQNNTASSNGGGIYLDNSFSFLENININNNEAMNIGGGIYILGGAPNLSDVKCNSNQANFNAAGLFIGYNSAPVLENIEAAYNLLDTTACFSCGIGGGILVWSGSTPLFKFVNIHDNRAKSGAGLACWYESSPVFESVRITNNYTEGISSLSSNGGGGGIEVWESDVDIKNTLIANNSSEYGAGIYSTSSNISITNTTIADNNAVNTGGGIFKGWGGVLEIKNSIIYNNTSSSSINSVYDNNLVTITPNYIDVSECSVDGGAGSIITSNTLNYDASNISSNPVLDAQFNLMAASPCRDIGSNLVIFELPSFDLVGNARFDNCTIDLGAFEYVSGNNLQPQSAVQNIASTCDQFDWIDGNSYNSDTTSIYVLASQNGCDSVVMLNLEINQLPLRTDWATANSASWPDVWAIAKDTVNQLIYIGGLFTDINGTPRNNLACIDANTGQVTSWDPDVNSRVRTIELLNGKVYIGGYFTSVGGQSRNYLASINATDGSVTNWNPNANNPVKKLVIYDSIVVVGGVFTTISGQSRTRLAAIDTLTGLPTPWNPAPNNQIETIALHNSTLYAGGWFSSIAGQSRNRIASFEMSTGTLNSWNANADNAVFSICPQNSNVYVGGDFSSIGGQSRNRIAELDLATGLATPWNPLMNTAGTTVRAISVSDTTIILGGMFNSVGGSVQPNLAMLDLTTAQAIDWTPNVNGFVVEIFQDDMNVYTGGTFTSSNLYGDTVNGAFAVYAKTFLNFNIDPTSPSTQTVCLGDQLSEIRYFLQGAGDVTVSGLPTGITYAMNNDSLVISGSPQSAGIFDFDILVSDGCTTRSASGSITVLSTDSIIHNEQSCEPFTWIDGNTYNSSVTGVNYILTNINGCDSIHILNLNVSDTSYGTDVQTACDSYTWLDGITYTSNTNSPTWTLTNAAGCDSIVTLNLTINSVSDVTTSVSGIIITSNNTNASYAWLDCDNNYAVISGETNQSYTPSANGNYAVELTENGCVDTSSCVAITTVGIIENSFNEEFTLYPNPTDGLFSIEFNSSQESITLSIMDASGKLIRTKNYNQVDLIEYELNQPEGIYLIEVSDGENQRSLIRLIKQ